VGEKGGKGRGIGERGSDLDSPLQLTEKGRVGGLLSERKRGEKKGRGGECHQDDPNRTHPTNRRRRTLPPILERKKGREKKKGGE